MRRSGPPGWVSSGPGESGGLGRIGVRPPASEFFVVGLCYLTILNIGQGRYDPAFRTMVKIACALGVSVDTFADLSDE